MRTPILTLVACFITSALVAAEARLYAPMQTEAVKAKSLDWAAAQGLQDKAIIESIGKLWALGSESKSADELLDRAAQTFGLVDPGVKQLLFKCQFGSLVAPDTELAVIEKFDPFVATNLRAFVLRFNAQSGFFDEALAATEKIEISQLIDPASFFFFKAVAEHRLLKRKEGLATLKLLKSNTADVPVRYASLADLMEKDLEALEEKSLNEVSRMMSDVERRLGQGRGGERVQKVEEEIVSRLDEIIKKLEEQAKGGGGGKGQQQQQAQQPAIEARVKGSTAPGEVDQRDIGHKSGWGALPPKEQAKAKNLIDRELPPHYRNAIEQYLKKLATRPEGTSQPGK